MIFKQGGGKEKSKSCNFGSCDRQTFVVLAGWMTVDETS